MVPRNKFGPLRSPPYSRGPLCSAYFDWVLNIALNISFNLGFNTGSGALGSRSGALDSGLAAVDYRNSLESFSLSVKLLSSRGGVLS